jgi:hypothetical protein
MAAGSQVAGLDTLRPSLRNLRSGDRNGREASTSRPFIMSETCWGRTPWLLRHRVLLEELPDEVGRAGRPPKRGQDDGRSARPRPPADSSSSIAPTNRRSPRWSSRAHSRCAGPRRTVPHRLPLPDITLLVFGGRNLCVDAPLVACATHKSAHLPGYRVAVNRPDPLIVAWQGRQLRIRHDDPRLSPYSPTGATIRSAVELASDVEGLRLVLGSALGDRYRVRVSDDGATVGLWRR